LLESTGPSSLDVFGDWEAEEHFFCTLVQVTSLLDVVNNYTCVAEF